jgi:hypothetical protein
LIEVWPLFLPVPCPSHLCWHSAARRETTTRSRTESLDGTAPPPRRAISETCQGRTPRRAVPCRRRVQRREKNSFRGARPQASLSRPLRRADRLAVIGIHRVAGRGLAAARHVPVPRRGRARATPCRLARRGVRGRPRAPASLDCWTLDPAPAGRHAATPQPGALSASAAHGSRNKADPFFLKKENRSG